MIQQYLFYVMYFSHFSYCVTYSIGMSKIAVAVIAGFGCASSFLLRNPTLLHKKKELRFKCHHVSHRGGAAENLENTMSAFKHASRLGTDMLEIDCHITKDGIVVVSHDNQLERTTGKLVRINETKYCDLPTMKSTLDVTFCKEQSITGVDTSIPKLTDVFGCLWGFLSFSGGGEQLMEVF